MEGPVEGEGGGEAGEIVRRRRRWPAVVAAVLVAAVAVGWWVWFRWLPGYRPGLEAGERYGVDVSSHQGEIDWERVAGDRIAFAYIKATEGGDFVDERFRRNWDGAAGAGLDRGAYHFFTLCRAGAGQAENFLRTVPSDPDALPPVVDLELAGNCSGRPDRAWIERELGAFLERVEAATGQTVVLYVGADFEDRYRIRDELNRPIWHRRVLIRPDVDGWWIWQFHGSASVEGIEGGADLNVMRGDHPTDVPTARASRSRGAALRLPGRVAPLQHRRSGTGGAAANCTSSGNGWPSERPSWVSCVMSGPIRSSGPPGPHDAQGEQSSRAALGAPASQPSGPHRCLPGLRATSGDRWR